MFSISIKYRFPHWLILPLLALITFILTEVAAQNPAWVEKYYARGIYPVIASTLSAVSNIIPFSLDDVFYGLLTFGILSLFPLVFLKKISLKGAGKAVINILAGVYILFYFLWGFNYYRSDLNQRLKIAEQEPDTEIFLHIFEQLVNQTNASYTSFDSIEKNKIDSLVEASYQRLAPVLQLQYPSGKRKDKSITLSRLFARAGISGYYGPFFNEVHVNRFNLPMQYPFMLAHEKAHQLGITGESEANFYAWLACTRSESKQLQYSGNLTLLRYFLYHGSQLEQFPEIVEKLDDRVKADINNIRKHWMELRNEKIDHAASKMNDAYLKSNKVEKGIEDYHGVVKHVMDFSLDSAFQRRWNLNSE